MLVLKQLRRKKSISQSDLAKVIGVSLRTIQLYEKESANIPIKNLTKLADYFGLGIDQLYAREVNESDGLYDGDNTDVKKVHTIKKLGPGKYLLTAPLVIVGQQADYLNNFDDAKYLNGLPRISFLVDQVSVGTYEAFEIPNNAMDNGLSNRIPQKGVVLGKRISEKELPKKIENDNSYWILVCSGTIMCKEITAFNKKSKSITCHSLNNSPEYPDFEVQISDVLAFYRILKKQVD